MKRMLHGIVLATMCSSFLHCASKKQVIIDAPREIVLTVPPVDPYPIKTTISGVVRNENGDILPNATVQLNQQQSVTADAAGKFSIETEVASAGTIANLYIQYDGMVPAVRSYHAVMHNAFYDITMHPPYECCIKKECFEIPFTSFEYDQVSTGLNNELTSLLIPLADSLKAYPRCALRFIAYAKGNKPGSRAEERLRQIQLFFSEKGITESRIIPIKVETKMSDVIEVEVIKD